MTERRTPLYDVHVRAGAQMVKGGGDFWFPLSYTGAAEEHTNTRQNVGMQDLSATFSPARCVIPQCATRTAALWTT